VQIHLFPAVSHQFSASHLRFGAFLAWRAVRLSTEERVQVVVWGMVVVLAAMDVAGKFQIGKSAALLGPLQP
jgi:hypothetical protein